MSHLETNLEVLSGRLPGLARLISASASVARFEIMDTASGLPSARLPGGSWLHSSRAPREEARRIAEAGLAVGSDIAILLGFGLGYLAEACLETGVARVLVCEAEPSLLNDALGARDMATILADERLGFLVGGEPESLISALESTGGQRASILELGAAKALSPDWYSRAAKAAERWIAKSSINENTQRKFGRLWVRNLAKNLDLVSRTAGFECLERSMEGLPALVLAAGPSLDLVLPWIVELRDKTVLVCVDTALRSILRENIQPDFLVVVDPQYWNWRHIAGLAAPDSILISESAAWPAVFRTPCRKILLGGSLFPLGARLESFAGRKSALGAGGSVATSAWDLARQMGCESIWIAGLDLGYPCGSTHARASLFEQRALVEGQCLKPAETAKAGALLNGHPHLAPATGGGEVLTDRRMALYAWWFESRLARHGAPHTLNLSQGGLAIPGMESVTLEDMLALPYRRSEIDMRLRTVLERGTSPESAERCKEGMRILVGELEVIAATAEEAAEAAQRAWREVSAGRGCAGDLALLDRADAAILGNTARDVAAFLMPPAGELLGRRARDLGESLLQSECLYRATAKAARFNLTALRGI
jgi:hypothetical protein